MMRKIGWIVFIFCVLVFGNYLLNQASNFLPHGFFIARADQPSAGLASIDFSVFDKGGAGTNYITQGYGRTSFSYAYINGWHNGIDIAATYGAKILSPAGGVVLATGDQDNYCPRVAFGKYIVIHDTANHLILLFAHLGTIAVAEGETINKDSFIGNVGATGLETGPHLHFSIFKEQGFSLAPAHGCGPYPEGEDVNPLNYLGTTYQ